MFCIEIILGSIFVHLNKKRPFLRIAMIGMCFDGFYANLNGILYVFQYGLMHGWQREGLGVYPNSLENMTLHPFYSPHQGSINRLCLLHIPSTIPQYLVELGRLAPCPFDYIIATLGLFPCWSFPSAFQLSQHILPLESEYFDIPV